jgi:hypothetical protein
MPGDVRNDYDSEYRGVTRSAPFQGNVEAVPFGCQGTRHRSILTPAPLPMGLAIELC